MISFLKTYNLKDIECFGNTNLPKCENIKIIIERNKAENPIYIGDTIGDYMSAKSADVKFIYAKYGLVGLMKKLSL